MGFNENLPADDSGIDSAEMRTQLIGLRDDNIVSPENYEGYTVGNYILWPGFISLHDTQAASWAWHTTAAIYIDRPGTLRVGMSLTLHDTAFSGTYFQIFKNGVAVAGTNHTHNAVVTYSYVHDLSGLVEGDYFQVRVYVNSAEFTIRCDLKCAGADLIMSPYCTLTQV